MVSERQKFAWRTLLIFNLALGAYMFAKARKKDHAVIDSKTSEKVGKNKSFPEVSVEPNTTTDNWISEGDLPTQQVIATRIVQEPIRKEHQL